MWHTPQCDTLYSILYPRSARLLLVPGEHSEVAIVFFLDAPGELFRTIVILILGSGGGGKGGSILFAFPFFSFMKKKINKNQISFIK
jgi:hypothetical protein